MKIIKRQMQLCTCCMTEHEVKTVIIHDKTEYQGVEVEYDAECEYCDKADEYYEVDDAITQNYLNIREAYNRAMGLMQQSEEIHQGISND